MHADRSSGAEAVIELRLPPAARFASALGVLTAALAAEEQFLVDEIADLRNAVHEVFIALILGMEPVGPHGPRDEVIVRFSVHDVGVDIQFSGADGCADDALGGSNARLVREKVDRLLVQHGTITLVKRRRLSGGVRTVPSATVVTREPD